MCFDPGTHSHAELDNFSPPHAFSSTLGNIFQATVNLLECNETVGYPEILPPAILLLGHVMPHLDPLQRELAWTVCCDCVHQMGAKTMYLQKPHGSISSAEELAHGFALVICALMVRHSATK